MICTLIIWKRCWHRQISEDYRLRVKRIVRIRLMRYAIHTNIKITGENSWSSKSSIIGYSVTTLYTFNDLI